MGKSFSWNNFFVGGGGGGGKGKERGLICNCLDCNYNYDDHIFV